MLDIVLVRRFALRSAAIAALATGAAAAAAEADAAADGTDASPGSIIVTANRASDRLLDMSGTYVFAGKLADVALLGDVPTIENRNLRLAFADIPGLLVTEVANGSWASLSYRGLGEPHESWNILTLQDAVPAVPDMYSYPAAYYSPPLELVERIEFLRGSAGLLYGPQPGGALNYVMRAPLAEAGANGRARLSYGSFDTASGLAAFQMSNGTLGVDAYLQHSRSDGPRRENSDSEQTSGQIRAYATGEALTAILALDYYEGSFGEPGGLAPALFALDVRAGSTPRDRFFARRVVPSLTLDWEASDRTQVTMRASTSHFERSSWRQAGGGFATPTPDGNVLIAQTQRFRTFLVDLRLRQDFGPHSLTIGTMAHSSDAPVSVDKGLSNSDFEGGAGAISRVARSGDTVAGFGEVRLRFGDVQIVPGFRIERLRQRVDEALDLATGSAAGGPPGLPNGPLSSRQEVTTVPLWGVGATWDANDDLRFVVNASRAFKPKLYNDGVTFQSGINAADDFEAGYAFTVEAGVQARLARFARIDASVFQVRFDNQVGFLAGPLPASPPFGAVGVGGARRQNVGAMRNRGVDLSSSLDLAGPQGMLETAGGTLRLSANLQLLDARFTSGPAEGFRPQYAPPYLARATLGWIGTNAERVALTFTAVGQQQGSDNNQPDFALDPYELLDLTADWPIGGGITIGAGITNILDARYAGRIRPGGGGGIDPGRPRAVYGSLGMSF